MLTELCGYLKNWFNRKADGTDFQKWRGEFTVSKGKISGVELMDGQFFRVIGSVFNDGVHQYSETFVSTLQDERFSGEVWAMAVPVDVVKLSDEIDAWKEKYETADSAALSPYNSESFGGYSYTKTNSSGGSEGTQGGSTWQSVFASKLSRYKKL